MLLRAFVTAVSVTAGDHEIITLFSFLLLVCLNLKYLEKPALF